MHAPLPFPGLHPSPVFENQTIRMIVRPTIGGERIRIRLSNAFGTSALKIGAAHTAISAQDSKIVPGSDHTLTFGGVSSISIPPGAPALSDAVDLHVSQSSEIAISLFLPDKTPSSTVHFWGQHKSYISETGDFSGKRCRTPRRTRHGTGWRMSKYRLLTKPGQSWLLAIPSPMEWGPRKAITPTGPTFWRIAWRARKVSPPLAVINEGIGGNRVLHDGAGAARWHAWIATSWRSRGLSA